MAGRFPPFRKGARFPRARHLPEPLMERRPQGDNPLFSRNRMKLDVMAINYPHGSTPTLTEEA